MDLIALLTHPLNEPQTLASDPCGLAAHAFHAAAAQFFYPSGSTEHIAARVVAAQLVFGVYYVDILATL